MLFKSKEKELQWIYSTLLNAYGEQSWWPAESGFEVMVGAILTQNTAWSNVEKAIAALKAERLLTLDALLEVPHDRLARLIRPSGYFNIKAQRLMALCEFIRAEGGETTLAQLETQQLRRRLLEVKGVGPETADDILLYAFRRPVFVIDTYTRRLLSRFGLIAGNEAYDLLGAGLVSALGSDVQGFSQYHALIVQHAKQHCASKPQCLGCCLSMCCREGRGLLGQS